MKWGSYHPPRDEEMKQYKCECSKCNHASLWDCWDDCECCTAMGISCLELIKRPFCPRCDGKKKSVRVVADGPFVLQPISTECNCKKCCGSGFCKGCDH